MPGVQYARTHASWDELLATYEPIQDSPRAEPGDDFTIVYTSGTTGVPKGVLHTNKSVNVVAHSAIELLSELGDNERFFSFLPLAGC